MQTGKKVEFMLFVLKTFGVPLVSPSTWVFFIKLHQELFLPACCLWERPLLIQPVADSFLVMLPVLIYLCPSSPLDTPHCRSYVQGDKDRKSSSLLPWYPQLPVPLHRKASQNLARGRGSREGSWGSGQQEGLCLFLLSCS